MSGGFVKINGSQRKVKGTWAKINGVWRKVNVVSGKINGVWHQAWKNAFVAPEFLSYPASIVRGDTFTWNTEDIIGADYELQWRYNGEAWSSSIFRDLNSGVITASTNTANTSIQLRVRAVAPTTHDKESSWVEGPVRSLGADTLDKPTGLSYPTTITRGQKIVIKWTAKSDVKYTLQATYNDGQSTAVVYSGMGGGSKEYTVSAGTQYDKIEFRIKASKTGFMESAWTNGPEVVLTPKKLGLVPSIAAPTPYNGQTITISWGAVTNAKSYLLEVQYNNGTWSRVYFGSSRSISYKVSATADTVEFRVRATAPDYTDGDWRYDLQVNIALPPLKTTTWTATKVRSWRSKEDWGWRDPGDTGGADINRMYQGAWNSPPWWGNHRGLAWMPYGNMRSVLAGKEIVRTRIYMYRINAGGYVSGQSIKLWTHNYSNVPAGRPDLSFVQGPFSSFARGEGKWITVSNNVAKRIRDGDATGIALYREDEGGYLYMSDNVKIEVQYR